MSQPDIWDPRTWSAVQFERRIYGDDNAQIYAVVDEIDYEHCMQWLWSPKYSRGGNKFYLRRSTQKGIGANERTRHTRFLHTEIMLRTNQLRPSLLHCVIDHLDGDAMNNRRSNLRWATHQMNVKNKNGLHAHESPAV